MSMNDVPAENEQWLTSGECSKCKRQHYCTKGCRANRQRARRALLDAVDKMFSVPGLGAIVDEFKRDMNA